MTKIHTGLLPYWYMLHHLWPLYFKPPLTLIWLEIWTWYETYKCLNRLDTWAFKTHAPGKIPEQKFWYLWSECPLWHDKYKQTFFFIGRFHQSPNIQYVSEIWICVPIFGVGFRCSEAFVLTLDSERHLLDIISQFIVHVISLLNYKHH